jgi:hypothetical protein
MFSGWIRTRRNVSLAVLLVGAFVLLGLAALGHTHEDGGVAPSHCELCRWTADATPTLAVVLLLAFVLSDAGWTHAPARVLHAQALRRRRRSRGPPLV